MISCRPMYHFNVIGDPSMSAKRHGLPSLLFSLACAAIALFGSVGATSSVAQTFSITGDFSATKNPNGVWTYGWLAAPGGVLHSYNTETSLTSGSGIDFWYDSTHVSDLDPSLWFNPSTTNYALTSTTTFFAGWAGFHPGLSGEYTDYRFTAPAAGTYNLALRFEGEESGGGGTTTHVLVLTNGTTLFSSGVNGFGAASLVTYTGSATLAAGQTLDIALTCGAKCQFDSTGIQGTITDAVPEPRAWLTMAGGIVILLFFYRRRASATVA